MDLPYVQNIKVAGLEPQEISRRVREALIQGDFLRDPSVVVRVKEYRSKRVSLLGQVQKAGSFPLTPGLTLVQAISLAGGLNAIAHRDRINLSRKTADGTKTVPVSLDAITDGRSPDLLLQAGDRIYVHERVF